MIQRILALPSNIPAALTGGGLFLLSFLLLNFGAERLEFKRKTRTYRPKPLPKDFIL